jgi:hypothetical protein
MALKTGNVFIVQALTGHKNLSMLERYVNVTADDVVKVMYAEEEPEAMEVEKEVVVVEAIAQPAEAPKKTIARGHLRLVA